MEVTIAIDDEHLDRLATLIAEKISLNGGGAAVAEADDFETEAPTPEITLSDMQDAVKEAVGKHGKDKIKASVKKIAGVDKVVDIPKDKYQAVLDGLKKVK